MPSWRVGVLLLATSGCVIGPKPEDPATDPTDAAASTDTFVAGGGDTEAADVGVGLDAPTPREAGADAPASDGSDASDAGAADGEPDSRTGDASDGATEGG